MNKPYIGITGFTSPVQVRKVITAMPRQSSHLLMVGVLVSMKTMLGETNKWPMRYPKLRQVAGIFLNDRRVLNLVHYHTVEKENLNIQLSILMEEVGVNCHGFQLNVAWPDPSELEKFRKKFPGKKIVLQIGQGAMDKMNNDPIKIARKVEDYDGLAEYLLLDGSGGKGLPLDAKRSLNILWYLQKARTKINLGLAGGLGPETLGLLDTILPEHPGLSIDMEGKVRNARTDTMSTRKSRKALIRALDMMQRKA